MARPKIACIVGTRPDAIKTMPVIMRLRELSDECEVVTLSTGQHREMLEQVFDTFGVQPDEDLGLMRHGQSLAELTSRALTGLDEALAKHQPDWVMAQGDTTTTFVASLAAFYRMIPFGHIEAGLRTHDLYNPFPEEFNRRAAGIVAEHHYAPTEWSAENLRRENVNPKQIYVTGNTGIDAVMHVAEREPQTWLPDHKGRVMLLTTHRRENWGAPQRDIANAALDVVNRFEDVHLVVPMHKNPVVREVLEEILRGHPRISLIEPPEYAKFVKLMQRSTLILTDSGGVQEEAPSFGIPVLILRETTERPEGVESGCAKLIGTNHDEIVAEAEKLLADEKAYAAMAHAENPYGNGTAAVRIADLVLQRFRDQR
jgi:UDP-N-acetylglucosamine 2-epimerase